MSKHNYILFSIAMLLIPIFANIGGKIGLTVGSLIILIYFILFKKDIILAFVISAVVNTNPVMILSVYSFGFPSQLSFQDIFFLLSFLVLLSPQIKEKRVDYNLKRFLPVLVLFALYQFFISYSLKVAPNNIISYLHIFYRNWGNFFGIFLIIPSYYLFKLDGKKFINAIVIATTIFTIVILINLYTPIQFFLVRTEFRNGAFRTFLFQSTLFYITTYIAVATFIFYGAKKAHIYYYLAGILTLMIPFIAMYRLELFTQVMTILLVVFIVSKYLNRNLVGFVRLMKIGVLLFALILVLAPNVYNAMEDIYVKTFKELLGTGEVEKGTTQTRTEHELPLHLSMINENPVLGVGFRKEWYMDFLTGHDWGLSDVPITSTVALYGFLGILIYYIRYFYFLPLSGRALRAIGKDRTKTEKNAFNYIVIISLRAYFFAMISFRLFYISYELTFPKCYMDYGVLLGIYYAAIYSVEQQNKKSLT